MRSVPLRNASTPLVLFSDGDADEHNRTWSCTRGSSLVRSPNGSLLAFFSGLDGCADGSRQRVALLLHTPALPLTLTLALARTLFLAASGAPRC